MRDAVQVKNQLNLLENGVDDMFGLPCVFEVTAARSSLRQTAPGGVSENGVGPASDPAAGP